MSVFLPPPPLSGRFLRRGFSLVFTAEVILVVMLFFSPPNSSLPLPVSLPPLPVFLPLFSFSFPLPFLTPHSFFKPFNSPSGLEVFLLLPSPAFSPPPLFFPPQIPPSSPPLLPFLFPLLLLAYLLHKSLLPPLTSCLLLLLLLSAS